MESIRHNIPIGINPPPQPRRSQRRDPLVREIKVCSSAQVPGIADAGRGFDVEPEVVDYDVVCADGCQEFVDLGLRGFAGALGLGACA